VEEIIIKYKNFVGCEKMSVRHRLKITLKLVAITLAVFLLVSSSASGKTITGGTIVIGEGETVDGFVAIGGTVRVLGNVDGDLTAFSGDVDIIGTVNGDLTAFAGDIRIDGTVTDDAEVFGGNVVVEESAKIGG
jgi:hypothetical protein